MCLCGCECLPPPQGLLEVKKSSPWLLILGFHRIKQKSEEMAESTAHFKCLHLTNECFEWAQNAMQHNCAIRRIITGFIENINSSALREVWSSNGTQTPSKLATGAPSRLFPWGLCHPRHSVLQAPLAIHARHLPCFADPPPPTQNTATGTTRLPQGLCACLGLSETPLPQSPHAPPHPPLPVQRPPSLSLFGRKPGISL